MRPAAVAGAFYPGSAAALRQAITAAFSGPLGPGSVPEPGTGRGVIGIVAPHAGYRYSAAGAAWAFAEALRGASPQAVVILGINHRGVGAPVALSPARGWETPLGVAAVDGALSARLQQLMPDADADARAHAQEHSLEVQVPFVQHCFPGVPIVPVALGRADLGAVARLGQALAQLAAETPLLMVASSDFSHYITAEEAARRDALALARIAALDPQGLLDVVQDEDITMCGVLPVTALLVAAAALGASDGRVLHYHTSGDVTGDRREVVGYGAAAIYR
jgi:AmmeMemoRadiSam system protein B